MWALIPVWFVLALLIPIAWSVGKAFRRSKGPKVVICPETSVSTIIELDVRDAVAMHVVGNPTRKIQYCSRWPAQQTCDRACVAQLAHTA
jgi:hypothetical protein